MQVQQAWRERNMDSGNILEVELIGCGDQFSVS